jgi:hypothetical protein
MKKLGIIWILTILAFVFFVSCTSTDLDVVKPAAKTQVYINPHGSNVNDVDISDLEINLTETSITKARVTESTKHGKIKRIPFPLPEYYALTQIGKGTIEGNIYLTDSYGRQVVGGDTRLYLNPVTSYSKQWYNKGYLAGRKMESADGKLFNYLKFTSSNYEGRFAFYGVPKGRYYLIGTVQCGTQCGFASPKSIRIAREVSVSGNQVISTSLTRDMR